MEYCEWDPRFPQCKEWFGSGAWKEIYPDTEEDGLAELMQRLGFEGDADAAAAKAQAGKKKSADGDVDHRTTTQQNKAGKKKAPAKVVTVELSTRNKRKHITAVRGLEAFGIDTSSAAKVFGKKFACGSAFQKGKHGLPDQIEIQGNYKDELPDFLLEKYPELTPECIETKDASKGKKGGGGGGGGGGDDD